MWLSVDVIACLCMVRVRCVFAGTAHREAKDYVLLFSVADDVRSKDSALEQVNTALVHGVPGYILVSGGILSASCVVLPRAERLGRTATFLPHPPERLRVHALVLGLCVMVCLCLVRVWRRW